MCDAVICHGPGHQSTTHCQVEGEHEIHEAYYGCYDEHAQWYSKQVFTGFFDEPPEFKLKEAMKTS